MRKHVIRMQNIRFKRAQSVRKKLRGTADRPRLCVVKTNKHIQVQLIDDANAVTLGSTSTCSKEFKNSEYNKKNKASAKALGSKIAEIAKGKKISEVIFDRGKSKYHGVVAELADAAREGGLKF